MSQNAAQRCAVVVLGLPRVARPAQERPAGLRLLVLPMARAAKLHMIERSYRTASAAGLPSGP